METKDATVVGWTTPSTISTTKVSQHKLNTHTKPEPTSVSRTMVPLKSPLSPTSLKVIVPDSQLLLKNNPSQLLLMPHHSNSIPVVFLKLLKVKV